ncbi:uncharacterized protein K452DRAFT_321603 [Aplosporella prunicola CBS 121167]|uniref:Trichothecene 3-O-acetyltransferase n=1 Tax=Aplosporella prunicola CBS 121167 TaxID=1176127 RepID=A0A6A6B1R1_9PEZI|nr:uncharacterized protein K452DRAFT_321603 [Aplosporella prunicola CBS 121167]KAF2137756.1 hypothetical protein K452DRAFT_321603 [Aplosporella prunicola CBS 121167]
MQGKQEYRVQPSNSEDAPPERVEVLSDYDLLMPATYMPMALIFELSPDIDRMKVVEQLKAGLAVTLSQYPVMAGSLKKSSKDGGRLCVSIKKNSTHSFWAVWDENKNLPSFEEMNKRDFPASLLETEKITTGDFLAKQLFSPLGDERDDEVPVATTQATFIDGGLIVALAAHHMITDGPGLNGFLLQWSENSKALAEGTPLPTFDLKNLDRSPLCANSIPDAARMEELNHKVKAFYHKTDPTPPLPPDFKMPEMTPTEFHFSKRGLEQLKADAQPTEGNSWVSTYDCIMAAVWRAVTRSRLPMHNPDLNLHSTLLHAVNNRMRADPPLPPRFLGCAVSLARPEGFSIGELVDMKNLPLIASGIRQSILAVTPETVQETAEWVAGTKDKNTIDIKLNAHMGLDFAGTSWQPVTVYQDLDFGFGLPKALRSPKPNWDGYIFVLPRRVKDDPEEGIETCICLEKSCMERLFKDEELSKYAKPRGL